MECRRVVLSGCSAGGKSTLLAALAEHGHATVPEPGRRVIAAGGPRPEQDLRGFLWACLALADADIESRPTTDGPVFHDRSAVDAVSGLVALGEMDRGAARARLAKRRYGSPVILFPPWEEIFVADTARTHGFDDARAEAERLARDYPSFGYSCVAIPRMGVADRVAWLLALLAD